MADRATGECVGIITLSQGNSVLDMSQVELCKVEDAQELFDQDTIAQCNTSDDLNNNDINPVKSIGMLVTDFVNQIERNYQLKSDGKKDALKARVESLLLKEIKLSQDDKNLVQTKYDMKPFKVGWLRRVSVCPNNKCNVRDVWYVTPPDQRDGTRKELRDEKDIMNYLLQSQSRDLTVDDFFMGKELLGLPAGCESSISLKAGTHSPDNFNKPFAEGWLRTVVIRTSDYSVTSVAYFSPPDSEGKRVKFNYKKDITGFLESNGIKSVDVDDFVCVRKVIGVSANFELITYHTQEWRENVESENNNTSTAIKCNFDEPLEDDKDLSFDTVVNSSEEDSDDSSSDSSDSSLGSSDSTSESSNSSSSVSSENIDYIKNSDTAGETDVPVRIVNFNGPHLHRDSDLTKVETSDDLAMIGNIAGSRAHGGPDPEQYSVDSSPIKGLVFSNDMTNVCRHKCHICQRSLTLPAMRPHTRTVHSMSIKQYCESFGNYRTQLSKVVYHRCGYCRKRLLLDMDKIHSHLRMHGVKLSEYSAKFLKLTVKK